MAPTFTQTLNRVQPKLPVTEMRTHAIFAPTDTHFRPARCEEVGCPAFHNGWVYDTAGQPAEITDTVRRSGRRYRVDRNEDTGTEMWHFEPGQPCFKASQHRIRLDRPELFIVRPGDWRGNPGGRDAVTQFSGPDAWADSLNTQMEKCTNG